MGSEPKKERDKEDQRLKGERQILSEAEKLETRRIRDRRHRMKEGSEALGDRD
jgi:hypothetical protein